MMSLWTVMLVGLRWLGGDQENSSESGGNLDAWGCLASQVREDRSQGICCRRGEIKFLEHLVLTFSP